MGLLFQLLSSTFMFIIVVMANHNNLEPRVYWRTVLPHTPIPSAIEQLLQPDAYAEKPHTSVNAGKVGVNVNTGTGTAVNVGKGGVSVNTPKGTSVNVNTGYSKPAGTTAGKGGVNVNVGKGGVIVDVPPKGKPVVVKVGPSAFLYSASDTQANVDSAAALFFLRQDLRAGKKFTLQLGGAEGGGAAFIPRSEAESVPFSTAELPAILTRYDIPAGSADAAAVEATLRDCEAAPAAGERKTCATSLESMVDFAAGSLGTRELVAVGTEGGGAGGGRREYEVRWVRKVAAAGGRGVVSSHPESYVHAVFLCHATAAAEVYEVGLAADGGGEVVRAVAVCHTDTGRWNPKHVAFGELKVKPGTVPVCHFLPREHVVWAVREE